MRSSFSKTSSTSPSLTATGSPGLCPPPLPISHKRFIKFINPNWRSGEKGHRSVEGDKNKIELQVMRERRPKTTLSWAPVCFSEKLLGRVSACGSHVPKPNWRWAYLTRLVGRWSAGAGGGRGRGGISRRKEDSWV